MLIPVSTDAPMYHAPVGTLGLIVVNVVCFWATGYGFDHAALDPWILKFGPGLNPLNWVSSIFAHAGPSHLIGNMLFLWCFGAVVEGKLGWRRFVPLYLSVGCGCSAFIDLVTLGCSGGGCLGASTAIFAIIGISLVWAPINEVQCLTVFAPLTFLSASRVYTFDIRILTLSLIFIGKDLLLSLAWPGLHTSLLHLVGCAAGLPIGFYWLRRGWVDCENWDLLSVMKGREGSRAALDPVLGAHWRSDKDYSQIPHPLISENEDSADQRAEFRRTFTARIHQQIDTGDFLGAADDLFEVLQRDDGIRPDEPRMRRLAGGLLQAEAWNEAEFWLREYIRLFPEKNSWARVRLAQLMLRIRNKPRSAIRILKAAPLMGLNEATRRLARTVWEQSSSRLENQSAVSELEREVRHQ